MLSGSTVVRSTRVIGLGLWGWGLGVLGLRHAVGAGLGKFPVHMRLLRAAAPALAFSPAKAIC